MTIPETTSAEAFERYVGGKCLRAGHGEAWRDIKAWIIALPPFVETLRLPSVSEPFLAWTMSGEIEFEEREGERPWATHRLKKGSFFLTSVGAPYDCRWKAVTAAPFQSMAVFIELPLLQRALEEVWGADAGHARLRDISAFTDAALKSLMEPLRDELMRQHASPLLLQGIAQAIAIHQIRPVANDSEPSMGHDGTFPTNEFGLHGEAFLSVQEFGWGYAQTVAAYFASAAAFSGVSSIFIGSWGFVAIVSAPGSGKSRQNLTLPSRGVDLKSGKRMVGQAFGSRFLAD